MASSQSPGPPRPAIAGTAGKLSLSRRLRRLIGTMPRRLGLKPPAPRAPEPVKVIAAPPPTPPKPKPKPDPRLIAAEKRIAALAAEVETLTGANASARREIRALERKHIRQFLTTGTFEERTFRILAQLLAQGKRLEARSHAYSLHATPATRAIGAACLFGCFHADGLTQSCFDLLDADTIPLCRAHFPAQFVHALRIGDPDAARREILDFAAGDRALTTATLYNLATQAWLLDLRDACRALLARAGQQLLPKDGPTLAARIHWLERYARAQPEPAAVAADEIRIALMDYKSPDYERSSKNLGDYIQTLALIGHLARFQFNGGLRGDDARLVEFVERAGTRIAADKRRGAVETPVRLLAFDRDHASRLRDAGPVWAIVFGWHMNTHFGEIHDFPYPDNIRPLFISFHVNRMNMLSDAATAYLKSHAPIGCRDWSTVYLLRARGIEAFFSGCLTLTTNQIFGDIPAEPGQGLAEIDIPARDVTPGARTYAQEYVAVREQDIGANLFEAEERLADYRSFAKIRTSRLHAALPCAAMGLDVEFVPRQKADMRFDGLIELADQPEARAILADGITEKLGLVFEKILAGSPPAEVRAVWRAACAEDLLVAERHLAGPPLNAVTPGLDLATTIHEARARAFTPRPLRALPETIHAAFAFDANLREQAITTVNSLVSNTQAPLHLHLLTRGCDRDWMTGFAARFPAADVTVHPMDEADYGTDVYLLGHISVATMDRLLLPDLLPDVDRLVYLDIDLVVLADIAALSYTELGSARIAARSSIHPGWIWSETTVDRAALRMPHPLAFEFRRLCAARPDPVFRCFNAGVMVLDLAGMRADGFCPDFLPWIWQYSVHDQDILNLYAGSNRVELDPAWNGWPPQELVTDPRIIHWIGPNKQWNESYAPLRERWEAYRMAPAPT